MATILLVDDDIALLETLGAGLEQAGYHVLRAQDGHEGATWLRQQAVDAVVSDIFMPDHAGVESMMSTFMADKRPAVVLISGGGPETAPDKAIGPAAKWFSDAQLYKPFRTEKLLDILAGLLPADRVPGGARPDSA